MLMRLSTWHKGVHSMFMFLTVQISPVALLCGLLLGDVEDNMKNKMDIINKNTLPFPKKACKKKTPLFFHPRTAVKFVQMVYCYSAVEGRIVAIIIIIIHQLFVTPRTMPNQLTSCGWF